MESLIQELKERKTLDDSGFRFLLDSPDPAVTDDLRAAARDVAAERFGGRVWLRGLIEWSNVCRNDCLYCGIRRSNRLVRRYSLGREEILSCCERIWRAGIRTFVLQGGENPVAAEGLAPVVAEIRASWPDAAITLSLGELPSGTCALLRRSGADRYLLRHESADPAHYARLHPAGMRLESRLACLRTLRALGFQTGMGMMVGSPWQTTDHLVADLRLLEAFRPEMIGVGPFIPHPDTPLGMFPAGSAERTLRLYSLLRLMFPDALIPATTALSALLPGGRLAGLAAGANVIMPNFTPSRERAAYDLYEGKHAATVESDGMLPGLIQELTSAGYTLAQTRGDYKYKENAYV